MRTLTKMLVLLTRMRQLCDHPSLFMSDDEMNYLLNRPGEYLQQAQREAHRRKDARRQVGSTEPKEGGWLGRWGGVVAWVG